MKLLLLLTASFIFFCTTSAFSQPSELVRFDLIGQKKVRSLLKKEEVEKLVDFEKMLSSCYDGPAQPNFSHHIFTLTFEESIEKVWSAYKSLDPKELGSGGIITFGLSYSRKHKKLIYRGDDCGPIEEGQIIISGLRYLGGFVKLAVAQEIAEINEAERSITFCYMENGKTVGSQKIKFRETADGHTAIEHETFYRSRSKFRDKKLYPGLHEKTIIEMHKNVLRKLTL